MTASIACGQDDDVFGFRLALESMQATCVVGYVPIPFWFELEVLSLRPFIVWFYFYNGITCYIFAISLDGNGMAVA